MFAMAAEQAPSVAPSVAPSITPSDSASNRPASTVSSSNSQLSSRYVRPMSPEDVYDDRERMSYMSASLVDRDRQYQPKNNFNSSIHQHAPPPASRHTSNTSSNMTTGTTVSGSENWETYSDHSELEPERDAREAYYAKLHGINGKRMAGGQPYGHMAPPPKMRMHERIDEGAENARMNSVTSDAAWSTEEESY